MRAETLGDANSPAAKFRAGATPGQGSGAVGHSARPRLRGAGPLERPFIGQDTCDNPAPKGRCLEDPGVRPKLPREGEERQAVVFCCPPTLRTSGCPTSTFKVFMVWL